MTVHRSARTHGPSTSVGPGGEGLRPIAGTGYGVIITLAGVADQRGDCLGDGWRGEHARGNGDEQRSGEPAEAGGARAAGAVCLCA